MKSHDYLVWAMTKDRTDEQYEQLGNRLANPIGGKARLRLLHAAMGISGESGELMDAIKKHILYDKALNITNVKEELGDLCWYMALMLDEVGSSFEEVMSMNRVKLEKRFPSGFTEKAAQDRADKKEEQPNDYSREYARKCIGQTIIILKDNANCADVVKGDLLKIVGTDSLNQNTEHCFVAENEDGDPWLFDLRDEGITYEILPEEFMPGTRIRLIKDEPALSTGDRTFEIQKIFVVEAMYGEESLYIRCIGQESKLGWDLQMSTWRHRLEKV